MKSSLKWDCKLKVVLNEVINWSSFKWDCKLKVVLNKHDEGEEEISASIWVKAMKTQVFYSWRWTDSIIYLLNGDRKSYKIEVFRLYNKSDQPEKSLYAWWRRRNLSEYLSKSNENTSILFMKMNWFHYMPFKWR